MSGPELGQHPSFSSSGAWLRLNDQAGLHLVETEPPPAGPEPRIEHFAFRAAELARFVKRLDTASVQFRRSTVPAAGLENVHFEDPYGDQIEVGTLHRRRTLGAQSRAPR